MIEPGSCRKDYDRAADGTGHRVGEIGLGNPGIPAVKTSQIENGREHLGYQIGQQDVSPGDGEGRGEPGTKTLGMDIGQEIEEQPQAGGNRTGPEAPGRSSAVLVDAVEAVQQPGAEGAAGDEQHGERDACADRGDIRRQEDRRQERPGDGDGPL